jgi:signal transduction histidine kinase
MRWPLRYQILLPMAGVMLAVAVAVSLVDAWLAGRRAHQQIETQLQEIGRTLAAASFPLTDNVLQQMRGLSGAEFIVASRTGEVSATSLTDVPLPPLPPPEFVAADARLAWQRRVSLGGQTYLHSPLDLSRSYRGRDLGVLHVLYPQTRYRQAWRDAVLPPAVTGLVALVVVVLLSSMVAARVTRPLHRLSVQVGRIARGDFAPLPIPSRDDELRDLALAFNHMAETLIGYEQQVRRHEKLRTLGRLGGGIAHQLRNGVTGCRLAIELHERQCQRPGDEELAVARQQLDLMEEYLQRFLALGKQPSRPWGPLDLAALVVRALALVRPKADHLGVDVQWSAPADRLEIAADADGLTQAIVNLLLNAVEAAVEAGTRQAGGQRAPRVIVRSSRGPRSGYVQLEILDSGDGPAPQVREQLYEPLISQKADGVGLGLSVARDVIQQHGGSLDWQRRDGWTSFVIALPLVEGDSHVETAGRG